MRFKVVFIGLFTLTRVSHADEIWRDADQIAWIVQLPNNVLAACLLSGGLVATKQGVDLDTRGNIVFLSMDPENVKVTNRFKLPFQPDLMVAAKYVGYGTLAFANNKDLYLLDVRSLSLGKTFNFPFELKCFEVGSEIVCAAGGGFGNGAPIGSWQIKRNQLVMVESVVHNMAKGDRAHASAIDAEGNTLILFSFGDIRRISADGRIQNVVHSIRGGGVSIDAHRSSGRVAVGGGPGKDAVTVLDRDWNVVATFPFDDSVVGISIINENTVIFASMDGRLGLANLRTKTLVACQVHPDGVVTGVAYNPEDKSVLTSDSKGRLFRTLIKDGKLEK